MQCFQLVEADQIEARIPIKTEAGDSFIELAQCRNVEVDSRVLESNQADGFIERVSVEFLDKSPSYRLVPETSIDSDQALLLLPPTKRFSYVSLSEDKCDLTSSKDDVSLLLILQPGNKILVTPQEDDETLTQWVLHFDGQTMTSKPLNSK